MRLHDLDPILKGTTEDGWLHFDCPVCGPTHQVAVHISSAPFHERDPRPGESTSANGKVKVWQASGDCPDSLTLSPSINIVVGIKDDNDSIVGWKTECWHGHITNGSIT